MFKPVRIGIAVGALACLAGSSQAQCIDSFSTGVESIGLTAGVGTSARVESGLTILGGQRDTTVFVTQSPYSQQSFFNITGDPAMPGAFFSAGVGDVGHVQLDYAGLHVQGTRGAGLHLTLTKSQSFEFAFINTNGPVRVEVMAITYGAKGQGDRASSAMVTTPDVNGGKVAVNIRMLDLKPVAPAGGVDLTNVDQISVKLAPVSPGGDFALGGISNSKSRSLNGG